MNDGTRVNQRQWPVGGRCWLLALTCSLAACATSEAPPDAADAVVDGNAHETAGGGARALPASDAPGETSLNADVVASPDAVDAAANTSDAGPKDGPSDVAVGEVSAKDAPTETASDASPKDAPVEAPGDAGPKDAPHEVAGDTSAKDAPAEVASDAAPKDAPTEAPGEAGAKETPADSSGTGDAAEASDGQSTDTASADVPGDLPDALPPTLVVTTRDLSVDNQGTVFNVADDYFNDRFIPPTPVANFGIHSQIITVPNDDGSLDVAWLDYANGKSAPWALPTPGAINITHIDASLAVSRTIASGISSYKLLGFATDPGGSFYVAYNKDHPFKTSTAGDPNNLNGNELHVTKFNASAAVWDQLIFGDQDNNNEATLGDPGGAASGVLGYDATNNKLVLYLGHSMMWFSATAPPTRHQAGFFRLLNPDTGVVIAPAGSDVIHFGSGWWYSHNFNQRLIIDGGNYYTLAHGDAFPRQLGFVRWSMAGYTGKNSPDFDQSYWAVAGNTGDNNTNAQTGQFARLSDGRFLIAHTSSEGRSARDVRLVFCDGTTGVAAGATALWLTSNQGTVQATMPKVQRLGNDVLVTYALWDSQGKHQLTWYGAVFDPALNVVAAPRTMANVEFVDSAPLFRFNGGPNAGSVGWVSGNASHTLSVHVASLAHP